MTSPESQSVAGRRTGARNVMMVLDGLAPEHRSVLRDVYFEHRTVRDIAAGLREPERRVASRIAAALQLFGAALIAGG